MDKHELDILHEIGKRFVELVTYEKAKADLNERRKIASEAQDCGNVSKFPNVSGGRHHV